MRTNFLFYLEWVDQLEVMAENGEDISLLFVAIKQYLELDEVVVDLDPIAQVVFNQMRAQIDRDTEKYAKVSDRRREAAKKRWKNGSFDEQPDAGGCNDMQTDANECKPMQVDALRKRSKEDDDDINNNNNYPIIPSFQPPASKSSRFIPPTVDEVAEYCRQRGNQVDPVAFVNFYESKGWMVGKSKMKKWKNAVITWERNRSSQGTSRRPTAEDIMATPYYDFMEAANDR